MSSFAIISDNTSGLTKDLRERFGVDDIALGTMAFPDGTVEAVDIDWERWTPETYFRAMRGKTPLFKSAAPNTTVFDAIFEKFAKQGINVLGIYLSGRMSSTIKFAEKSAQNIMAKYPGVKIVCIDSERYSMAMGLMVIKACEYRDAGHTFEETVQWLNQNNKCFHQMGPVDDLSFLAKANRISKGKAFMGNLVGVKPLGDFNCTGLTEILHKAKGLKSAFELTCDYISETITDEGKKLIIVADSDRSDKADTLAEMIKEKIKPAEVIRTSIDMGCGANIGPGLIAAYYYGKPISEGMTEEKAIFEKLTEK